MKLIADHASLLGIFALVTACASTPVATSEATEVTGAQILSPSLLTRRPGAGIVIVKRDVGLTGAICRSRIYVDGNPVAEIYVAEKVTLYLPPGDHILGAKLSGLCGGGTPETAVNIASEQTKTFRVGAGQGSDLQILPTAF